MPRLARARDGLRGRFRNWILAAGLVALGCSIYAPAIRGTSLWDDDSQNFHTPALRSAAGLMASWTAPATPDYLPLLDTVEWLQWHAWGGWVAGYHATSIGLHLLGALLLWRLLARLGVRGAAWGGWLFAVHPLAVESVAWMAELKNTLSLPPLLLALTAYVDYDLRGRRGSYAAALAWFLAALLCKASVVMLPAVLLLYALWRHGRIRPRDLRDSAPFFALAVLLGAVALWFQDRYALGELRLPETGLAVRAAQAGSSLGFYLGRILWPSPLMPVYPAFSHVILRSVLVGAAVALAAIGGWRSRNPVSRRLVWRRVGDRLNLVPVLGLLPMSYLRIAPVADHLAYIALAGGCGLVGAGLGALELSPQAGRRLLATGAGAALVGGAGRRRPRPGRSLPERGGFLDLCRGAQPRFVDGAGQPGLGAAGRGRARPRRSLISSGPGSPIRPRLRWR